MPSVNSNYFELLKKTDVQQACTMSPRILRHCNGPVQSRTSSSWIWTSQSFLPIDNSYNCRFCATFDIIFINPQTKVLEKCAAGTSLLSRLVIWCRKQFHFNLWGRRFSKVTASFCKLALSQWMSMNELSKRKTKNHALYQIVICV